MSGYVLDMTSKSFPDEIHATEEDIFLYVPKAFGVKRQVDSSMAMVSNSFDVD